MNKLALLITALALLLTSCSSPTTPEVACSNVSDNHFVWGQVAYTLPKCWTSSDSGSGTLLLASELTDSTVTLQKTIPMNNVAGMGSFPLPTGETLFVIPSSPEDPEAEDIFDSINILSFNVAPSSCEAPDSTYAQSLIYTWQGITFGLPFCWGAEESTTIGGDPQLALYKSEDKGKYLRVNFWHDSPLNDNYTKLEDTKIAGFDAEHYVYPLVEGTTDNSNVYVLASDPVWYIETNATEDYEVQLILSSLTIIPVTISSDSDEEWYNRHTFHLPSSWESEEIDAVEGDPLHLHLTSEDGETYVDLYYTVDYNGLDSPYEETSELQTFTGLHYMYRVIMNGDETRLYSSQQSAFIHTNDPTNSEVQSILNSIMMYPHQW